MRGTPLITPLRQPGTKQRRKALWRSALFSSTRLRSKNLISGHTYHPFIPVCTGSVSGMQNPLANCQESRPGVHLLIARGRHLPSSWTHQLHSTHLFTHTSLPAGLNLWTIYTPHPHPSGWLDYLTRTHLCMCL